MSKTIEVEVDPKGGIEIETKGFAGPECEKATAELERALGKTTKNERTPEFNRRPGVTQTQGH